MYKNSLEISSIILRSLKYSKETKFTYFLTNLWFEHSSLFEFGANRNLHGRLCTENSDQNLFDRRIRVFFLSSDRIGQSSIEWSIEGVDGGGAWNEDTAWCVWGVHYWHTCYSRRHGRRARLVYVVARMYIPGLNVTPVIPNSVYCLYLSSAGWLHFHSYNTFAKLRFRLG